MNNNEPPAPFTPEHQLNQTRNSARRIQEYLRRADAVQQDTRKDERREALRCKPCFYLPSLAGASSTWRACASCGADQLYGTRTTSELCAPCAAKAELCRHCGGDLESRFGRSDWPSAYKEESTA